MAHDDKQKQIVERHRSDDTQKHRLPAVRQLLIGQEFGRRRDCHGNLYRPERLHAHKGGRRIGIRRYQEDEIAVINRATAEREGIARMVGLDQLAINHPVHGHLVQQRIADFQNPVHRLWRNLDSQPETAIAEPAIKNLI